MRKHITVTTWVIMITMTLLAIGSSAAILSGPPSDTEQLRQLLLNNPDNPDFDFNGDGKVDIADLVIALNADNSIYLRPDIRYDAMQESVDFFSSLASMELSAKNAALIQWLEAHPLYDEVGLATDETVWATFTDGLPIKFIDNRSRDPFPNPPPPPPPAALPSLPEIDAEMLQRLRAGTPALILPIDPKYFRSELPFGRKVEIINGFGRGWEAQQTATNLVGLFDRAGYTIGPVTRIGDVTRTIADLKNLTDVDVLYLGGHGGSGWFDEDPFSPGVTGKYFSVTTFDSVSQDELILYDAEYRAKEISPVVCVSADDNEDNAFTDMYWSITENFITSYVSFGNSAHKSENSLVVVDACSSADFRFMVPCFDKGASSYMGWDVPVGDRGAAFAMNHLFARLLGEDSIVAGTTTNVRPFDMGSIFHEMKRLNLIDIGGSSLKTYGLPVTHFSILRPMLHMLHVYPETEKVELFGVFGDNQTGANAGEDKFPVVTVDGSELSVIDWRSFRIVCDLPATGFESVGEVVVMIDGLKSNPIPITEFSGRAEYTRMEEDPVTHNLNQIANYSFIYRSRLSIHPFRMKPDSDPVWPWLGIASLESDDSDIFRLFIRHLETNIVNTGNFEAGSSMLYLLGGSIREGGCDGFLTGNGELDSFALDPHSQTVPMQDSYTGHCRFLSLPDNPSEVQWIMGVLPIGARGTFTPIGDCGDGPEEWELSRGFDTIDASVMVDTATFEIPEGVWVSPDGKNIMEWDALGPCCENEIGTLPN